MSSAIYPGSFDPVTNGHLDIIERTAAIFDKVTVAILINSSKTPTFTVEERIDMLKKATAHIPNVEIEFFDGLLVDFVRSKNANVIIKGLRAVSDFEYEFQMAMLNKSVAPDIETLFMMTGNKYSYLSSSIVKELGRLGAPVDEFVPQAIMDNVTEKLRKDRKEK
ncbi:MAG: pantetheine-phosphate adenylyltransferase [Ruminococcaceae bacterium]|nr:pantetheine-phosphate adenylyltransferase [Oscillospiraceae bacterium]